MNNSSRVLFFLIIATVSYTSVSIPVFDPLSLQEYLFYRNPTSSQQYVIIMTAQSTVQANFFQFDPITPIFPNLMSVADLNPLNRNITLIYRNILPEAQFLTDGFSLSSCVNQTFLDCTAIPLTSDICSILQPPLLNEGIETIKLGDLNCSMSNTDPLCAFSLNGNILVDPTNNPVFISQDNLCPERFIKVTIMLSVLKASIKPSTLVGGGNITFHFYNVNLVSKDSWMMSISSSRLSKASDVSNNVVLSPFTFVETVDESQFSTLIKTQLVRHNYSNTIYCRYGLNFTGFVRGIYVNDYPSSVHSPNDINLELEKQVESTIRLPLRANQFNFISIFGYRINQTALDFFDCRDKWENGASIQVQFSSYFYENIAHQPQDYAVQKTNYTCSYGCLRCTAENICIKCQKYLFQGKCVSICPKEFPIADYRGICNSMIENGAALLETPNVNNNQTQFTFYNDYQTSNPFVMVFFASKDILLGSGPNNWLSGTTILAESIPVFAPELPIGANNIVTQAISAPNTLGSPYEVTVIYYPVKESSYLIGKYWALQGLEPSTSAEKLSPDNIFNLQNTRYTYLDSSGFYLFKCFVNCTDPCTIKVRSDGRVKLLKNDATVLFDVNFTSRWTYSYQYVANFVQIKFVVTNANFFQPFIESQNFHLYLPSDPFFLHTFIPLTDSTGLLNIPNCVNANSNSCLSCDQNFFLSLDKSVCSQNCDINDYSSITERICTPECKSTEVRSPNNTACLPACDQLGFYYSKDQGCQMCVPECGVCKDETKCLTCRFFNPLNTEDSCFRKEGQYFSGPDFNRNQDIRLLKDSDTDLAIVIADESVFHDNSFFFVNKARKVPRILKVIRMENITSEQAEATIPPISISQSGSITMHYMKIKRDYNSQDFNVLGARDKVYIEWPIESAGVPKLDSNVGLLEYNNPDGLMLSYNEYLTVVASRLYRHDQANSIECQLEVNYTGYLRAVYANDYLILSDSTNSDIIQEIALSRAVMIESNEIIMITFLGYRLFLEGAQFVNCLDSITKDPISSIAFESYTFVGPDANPDTFQVTNNTYCDSNCLRCVNSSKCLRCEPGFFLNDGKCETTCPNKSNYQLFYGFCELDVKKQGFKISSSYSKSSGVLSAKYHLPLGFDTEMLIIAHPFQISLTPQGSFAFVPDNDPSLARGEYQLINYPNGQIDISLNIPVKSEAKYDYDYVDIITYTVRRNLILFVNYTSLPPNVTQLKNSEGFSYIPFPSGPLLLQIDKVYHLDFFLNCSNQCQISFELQGDIKILLDERSYLFEGYIEPFVGPTTLQRNLTGFHHILIQIWNCTSFKLTIKGPFNVLTQGQYIFQDRLTDITREPCTQSNCQNCYKNRCLSCQQGYFLDEISGNCTKNCPQGTKGDLFQRFCGFMNCTFSTNMFFVGREDYCVWNCLQSPQFYYNISDGCTKRCNSNCSLCSGPLDNHCLSCVAPKYLDSNKTCLCPIGTQIDATGECKSLSFLNLKAVSPIYSCNQATAEATIRADELSAYNPSFSWELKSSNSSSTSQTSLKNYLTTQTSGNITIPLEILESNKFYNLTASYVNVLGMKITNWTIIEALVGILPDFTFQNTPLVNFISNTLVVDIGPFSCLRPNINVSWTPLSGPLLSLTNLQNPKNPLQIALPSCSLPPNSDSTLKIRAWVTFTPSKFVEKIIQVKTLPERFEAIIEPNSKSHPETIDLNLQGQIEYLDQCSFREPGTVQYIWMCNKTTADGNIQGCPNTGGLFGLAKTTNQLIIPTSFFAQGERLSLLLKVQKNGVTKNKTLTVNITGPNTFIVNLACESSCLKYASNKEYMISAVVSSVSGAEILQTLTSANFANLTFKWRTNPNIPFAFYQDKMKLLSNNITFPANVTNLCIDFSVMNSTHKGSSSLLIPINRPPSQGIIDVTPKSGISLSTNFTISAANWQDNDFPIKYQYYYSFIENDNFIPLLHDFMIFPNIVTKLPAQSSGGPVYIRVYIKDLFEAETIIQTQVTVNPGSQSFEASLQKYNDLLNLLDQPGMVASSSRIAMVSNELSEWENKLTNNIASNICPLCSNHGSCPTGSTRCECDEGWTLVDCSFTVQAFDEIIQLKEKYLTNLSKIHQDAKAQENLGGPSTKALEETLYQTLKQATENEHFNTNTTLIEVQKILEETLGLLDPNTVLTPEQAVTVSEILSDMLSYSSTYDCAGATQFTKDLASKTTKYLEKISKSSLNGKIPAESATIIDTENVDMYFDRLSLCDLSNMTISMGDSPGISINLNTTLVTNCSLPIDIEYYAFNDKLLGCSGNYQNISKNVIAIEITNPETGENLDLNITVTIYSSVLCPSVCDLQGDTCSCDNLSPFDVKSQIIKLFELSNIANLFKLQTLLSFEFWKAAPFWGIAFFSVWILVTMYIVKSVIPAYSVLARFKVASDKNKFRFFWTAFLLVHPLFSVYCTTRKHFSKRTWAFLYFTRSMLLLAVTSAFNESDSDGDFFSELFSFDLYLSLLPFFTIIPICEVLVWTLKAPLYKDSTKENKKSSWACLTARFSLGHLLMIVLVIVSLLIIIVINANQNEAQRLMWTVDFIYSFFQDIFITPFIHLAFQYLIFKFYSSEYCQKSTKLKKIIFRLQEPNLVELKESLITVKPVRIPKTPFPLPTPQSGKHIFQKSLVSSPTCESPSNFSSNVSYDQERGVKPLTSPADTQRKHLIIKPLPIKEASFEDSPLYFEPRVKVDKSDPEIKDGEGVTLSNIDEVGTETRQRFRAPQSTIDIYDDLKSSRGTIKSFRNKTQKSNEDDLKVEDYQELPGTSECGSSSRKLRRLETIKLSSKESDIKMPEASQSPLNMTTESALSLFLVKKEIASPGGNIPEPNNLSPSGTSTISIQFSTIGESEKKRTISRRQMTSMALKFNAGQNFSRKNSIEISGEIEQDGRTLSQPDQQQKILTLAKISKSKSQRVIKRRIVTIKDLDVPQSIGNLATTMNEIQEKADEQNEEMPKENKLMMPEVVEEPERKNTTEAPKQQESPRKRNAKFKSRIFQTGSNYDDKLQEKPPVRVMNRTKTKAMTIEEDKKEPSIEVEEISGK